MSALVNLLFFVLFIGTTLVIAILRARFGVNSIKGIMRNASIAPWDFHEFLNLNPSSPKSNEFYRFSEESIRSHAHRYVGRFDGAVLHWEEVPILDLIIENKFPVSYLPDSVKKEDIFQAGLYALALAESGVSCRDTKLVIIYCLQDVAKRCLHGNSQRRCWDCGDGKTFSQNFDRRKIVKNLTRINDVWYKRRNPRASPSEDTCRSCPYSKNGGCNYSAV
jgi:hypothetical protein